MQHFRTGIYTKLNLSPESNYVIFYVMCLIFVINAIITTYDIHKLITLCSLYDLANVVPTLAKFYHQASEAYEQACTRFINTIILYVSCSLLCEKSHISVPQFYMSYIFVQVRCLAVLSIFH